MRGLEAALPECDVVGNAKLEIVEPPAKKKAPEAEKKPEALLHRGLFGRPAAG
jgi:hypothetical protein